MEEVLLSVSLILVIATILAIIARLIRQPPIIAYLIAGILSGPLFFNLIGSSSSSSILLQTFAHLGVAFLLFIVGLSLDFRVLKEVGGASTFAGLIEIGIIGGIGVIIALGLGFGNTIALYLGAALAFSSTVVIVKILSDKKEIDTLHGKLALGILIVEDFVAAIALMLIPLMQSHPGVFFILTKLALVLSTGAGIFLISIFILPKCLDYLARNQEVLFLFGIAWALALAALFDALGFSLEIGALIAGMSLASSKYTLELGGKIKPLRDFFTVLFFVFFGSQLSGSITLTLIYQALIFSTFIVLGKPVIVMTLLRIFGYKKRTNFLAGSSFAQISEFSLILALLGFTLGHLNQEIMSLVVLIAIITIGISSYSIYYAHRIFERIAHLLNMFEGKKYRDELELQEQRPFEIILFGYHRIGYKVLKALKELKTPFIVVDYNPKIVLALRKEHIDCVYGDAGDKYFLSEIGLEKAKLIISTIPDENSNLMIKERLKEINAKAIFIATAEQPRVALNLYEKGVDYVVVPHHLGGDYISHIIAKSGTRKDNYKKMGKAHYHELKKARNQSNFL